MYIYSNSYITELLYKVELKRKKQAFVAKKVNSPSCLNRNKWATDDGWFACTHRQTASASKYSECRPSMMTISWCLSKKHSTADSGVRAMLHLNPARSHAHQNASLWLSSLAKTSNTWARQRRREREVLLVCVCERYTVFHPVQRCVTMELRCEIPHGPGHSGRLCHRYLSQEAHRAASHVHLQGAEWLHPLTH